MDPGQGSAGVDLGQESAAVRKDGAANDGADPGGVGPGGVGTNEAGPDGAAGGSKVGGVPGGAGIMAGGTGVSDGRPAGRDSPAGWAGSNSDRGEVECAADAGASQTESGGGGIAAGSALATAVVRPGTGGGGSTVQGSSEVGSMAGSHGGVPVTWACRAIGLVPMPPSGCGGLEGRPASAGV